MSIKYLIFCLYLFLFSGKVYSQGAWDIKYMPISSITKSLIGKEVRIDFKAFSNDTISKVVNVFEIRKLLSTNDTINLKIDSTKIIFVESWKIYVDDGSLKNQILLSADGKKTTIKEIYLISIDDLTLTFEIIIYQLEHCNTINNKKELQKKQKITIDKSNIKGLLVSQFN